MAVFSGLTETKLAKSMKTPYTTALVSLYLMLIKAVGYEMLQL